MRLVPVALQWALVVALPATLTCCGKKSVVKSSPPPQLTSPRIAFTQGTHGIVLYDPATGSLVPLSSGQLDQDPAISPDGRRIAFVNSSGGTQRLMTMAVNGTDRRPVLADPHLAPSDPHWAPDSRRMVFTGTALPSGATNVYTITAAGDSLRPVTTLGGSRAFAWSRDGSRILYSYRDLSELSPSDSLREIDLSGSGVHLVFGPTELTGADYSPDGYYVVFTYQRGVRIVSLDGTLNVGHGQPDIRELGNPSWSPDGSLIVLSAHSVDGGRYRLFVTTPAVTDTVQTLLGGSEDNQDPDWGPRPPLDPGPWPTTASRP